MYFYYVGLVFGRSGWFELWFPGKGPFGNCNCSISLRFLKYLLWIICLCTCVRLYLIFPRCLDRTPVTNFICRGWVTKIYVKVYWFISNYASVIWDVCLVHYFCHIEPWTRLWSHYFTFLLVTDGQLIYLLVFLYASYALHAGIQDRKLLSSSWIFHKFLKGLSCKVSACECYIPWLSGVIIVFSAVLWFQIGWFILLLGIYCLVHSWARER